MRVVWIVDPERWLVSIGGDDRRIRLIGVNARFAPNAGCSLSDDPSEGLVAGAPLRIEQDSRAEDDSRRAWVWLWSGDELINAAILREGLATLSRHWPNQRHETEVLQAQQSAARGLWGLWGECLSLRRAISTVDPRRSCDPSYPGRCADLHDLDGDGDGLGCERYNPM